MAVVQPFPAFLTLSERGGMKKGKEGRKEGRGIHIHRLLLWLAH